MVPCLVTLTDLNALHGLSAIAEFLVSSCTRLFADDSRTGSGPGMARRVEIGQMAYDVKSKSLLSVWRGGGLGGIMGAAKPPSPCMVPPLVGWVTGRAHSV